LAGDLLLFNWTGGRAMGCFFDAGVAVGDLAGMRFGIFSREGV
jgi:hypothetical protein